MQDSTCGSLAPAKKVPGVVRRSCGSFEDVPDALTSSKAAWNGSSSGSDLAESDVMLLDDGLEGSSLSRWIEELIHEPAGEPAEPGPVLDIEGEEFTGSRSGLNAPEASAGGVDAVAADLINDISPETASSSSALEAAFDGDVAQQFISPRSSDPMPIFGSAHAALSDILKRLTPPALNIGEFPHAFPESTEFDVLEAVKSGLGRTRSASSALFSTHVQEDQVSTSSRKQIRILGGQHKQVEPSLSSYPPDRTLTQSRPVPEGRMSAAAAATSAKLAGTSFLGSGSRSAILSSLSPPRSPTLFFASDPIMSGTLLSSYVPPSIDSMAETIAGPFSSSPSNQQFQFSSGALDNPGISSKLKWGSVSSGENLKDLSCEFEFDVALAGHPSLAGNNAGFTCSPPAFKPSNLSPTSLPNDGKATISDPYGCQVIASVDPFELSGLSKVKDKAEPQAQNGLRIIQLLLECAEAVSNSQTLLAQGILLQLKTMVSPKGDSMQRVAACFTEALHCRLSNTGYQSYAAIRACGLASSEELRAAYQILYQACPYIKFAHFTSNQAILEAFDGETRVHILDLDILQGYQWSALMQTLAARPGGPPSLRITGVGIPLESVLQIGKRLSELADWLRIPFVFHAVGERLEDVKVYMMQRRSGEALAVNSVNRLHQLLGDQRTGSPLMEMLHMVYDQSPKVVTLVEQEAAHNGQAFLSRFLEALHYYSAIFDSLDATLPRANPERAKVEQVIFAREITNIIACEGNERVERHEKFERWKRIMESLGFKGTSMSAKCFDQARVLLGLYPCDGYTLVEDNGCLLLGWQDRPVIGASAWHC